MFPGFGGQSFIPGVLDTVRKARAAVESKKLQMDIEIDGGIDLNTLPLALEAGANVLVAGNAIFGQDDPAAALRALQDSLVV